MENSASLTLAPILLRVESKAGHGAGRPTEKIIDEVADRYAFLTKNLNFTPTLSP
jgi:prolyl oligopeptidase